MAKKTSKRKSKPATALPQSQDIPEGFKQLGGGYAATWKPENVGDSLMGTVSASVREVELTIGRKKTERRCFEVTTEDGERFTVWESAALGELFDQVSEAGEGVGVYLRFDGLGKKKAGQNPPKLFTVALAA